MSTRTRIVLLVAGVAIAVVAFVVLKPEDTKKEGTNATAPAKPAVKQITVKGGKPLGGVQQITVSKGDPVQFAVRSDVSDEIHVHGFDFHKDVKAGGTVRFSFPAKMDGEFEIELEGRKEQIANLVVNP
jgi:hypothetical protein